MSAERVFCVEAGCDRKANNLCPHSRCLNHCHDFTEANARTAIPCRRHAREWANKTQQDASSAAPSRKRARPGPSSTSTRRPLEGVSDPFFVLGREATARPPYNLRQCPGCDKMVPSVGSFFMLHLAQCDTASFYHFVEGTRPLPPALYDESYERRDDSVKRATDVAAQRVALAQEIMAQVLDTASPNVEQQLLDLNAQRNATLEAVRQECEALAQCFSRVDAMSATFARDLAPLQERIDALASARGAARDALVVEARAFLSQQLLASGSGPLVQRVDPKTVVYEPHEALFKL